MGKMSNKEQEVKQIKSLMILNFNLIILFIVIYKQKLKQVFIKLLLVIRYNVGCK